MISFLAGCHTLAGTFFICSPVCKDRRWLGFRYHYHSGGYCQPCGMEFRFVANVSMISVAGKTPEERSQLSSTRAAWANFSKSYFLLCRPGLAAIMAGFIGEVNQYGAAAFVLGCIMAVLYYAHFRMFDGYEQVQEVQPKVQGQKQAKEKDRTGGMDLIRALLQNPPLIALLIADLANLCLTLYLWV